MNRLTIIGNLTHSPELRTTQSGIQVCSFTVAVNQRKRSQDQEEHTDYFKVTAWRGLADVCGRYLQRGHKVCITGPVGLETWTGKDGTTKAGMTITAEDMEMLTSKAEANSDLYTAKQEKKAEQREEQYKKEEREAIQNEPKYVEVDTDDLPF